MERIERLLEVDENPHFSPSRLASMATCPKQGWFNYVLRYKDFNVPSYVTLGSFLHKKIEKIWVSPEKDGIWLPGYKSREKCLSIAKRDWKFRYAGRDENGQVKTSEGHPIEWFEKDNEGYGLLWRVEKSMGLAYDREIAEGPWAAAELPVKVEFKGIKLYCKIDALWERPGGGIIIEDHKSGSEPVGEYFVRHNQQLSINSMSVFEALQRKHTYLSRIFPKYAGISLNEFLDPGFLQVQIHDINPRKDKEKSEVYSSSRTEHDFNEVIASAGAARKSLIERDFHANKGHSCDICFFRKVCNDYHPEEYYKDEFSRRYPLFAGLEDDALVSDNPKINTGKQKPRQSSFRFNPARKPKSSGH